mmetsp:Transcript_12291/g.34533  ORF Transcript_12291/g.34533 Transcript_12291/m.34533 type:complete len:625 (+) Transcript_12291:89-1963(+)
MDDAATLLLGSHMAVAAVLLGLLSCHRRHSNAVPVACRSVRHLCTATSLYISLIGIGLMRLEWSLLGAALLAAYGFLAISVVVLNTVVNIAEPNRPTRETLTGEQRQKAEELAVHIRGYTECSKEAKSDPASPCSAICIQSFPGVAPATCLGPVAPPKADQVTARRTSRTASDNLAKRLSLSVEDDPMSTGLTVEILSVDDDRMYHSVLRRSLKNSNFKLTSALTSEECLDILALRHARGGVKSFPTMMLMDVNLTNNLGYKTVHEIRRKYPCAAMPIVMVSSAHDTETVVKSLMAGANDFISKPFCLKSLTARIGAQLRALEFWEGQLEAQRSDVLLKQMLPESVIARLNSGVRPVYDNLSEVSILFSDIVGFTTLASVLPTEQLIHMLDTLFTAFDELTDKHGVYKVETIGDAYMVVAGHDEQSRHDHARRMMNIAADMVETASSILLPDGTPLEIRVGIHSGPAYAGVVGRKMPRYCLFGDTVNVASRMESNSFPLCIHVSNSTYNCYKGHAETDSSGKFGFLDLGHRDIKGKGFMHTWLVQGIGNAESAYELYGRRQGAALRRSIDGSDAGSPGPSMVAAMPWQSSVDFPTGSSLDTHVRRRRSIACSRPASYIRGGSTP